MRDIIIFGAGSGAKSMILEILCCNVSKDSACGKSGGGAIYSS